jgi:hypothetical protein
MSEALSIQVERENLRCQIGTSSDESALGETAKSDVKRARPLTSVELLDAAVWREIGSEDSQPAGAFVEALASLVGRWLLVRSDAPGMDLFGVMCRAHAYIERGGAEQNREREWTR